MRAARRVQEGAIVQLHSIARPHFKYPPLELNAWYLPQVWRWERPSELPPDARRSDRKLLGRPVIPALVEWMIPPEIWVHPEDKEHFVLHLRQRTGKQWDVDWTHLPENRVIAELLSRVLYVERPELQETTRLMLPASSRPRVSIWRGLFHDEWKKGRAIEANRHSPEDAPRSLDLRRMW